MAKTLYLIDASSNVYRAFYALPSLANARGVPTHATLGFVNMLGKVLREERPDAVAVVWDAPGGARRRKALYEEYKAQREAAPEDLRAQIPHIKAIVQAHGLAQVELEGEEADDVIASLTRAALASGFDVVIVSTDRDLMQLVSDRVAMLDTMRERRYDARAVEERFGVGPERIVDLRALTGDSSDNIPGVRGIGDKGAAELLREYGTLENVLAHAPEIRSKRYREALLAGAESARLSRELSRLRDDLELPLGLEGLRVAEPDVQTLRSLYEELGFRRHLEELGAPAPRTEIPETAVALAGDPASVREVAEAVADLERVAVGWMLDPDEPMTGELVSLAVATDPGHVHHVAVDGATEEALRESLAPSLAAPSKRLVGYELKRLAVALARRGVSLESELRDVSVAAYVHDPTQQVGRPEILAKAYLGRSIPSAEDVLGRGAKRRPARSVALDDLARLLSAQLAAALDLEAVLVEELRRTGQLELYERVEVPLVSVLARMEAAGVRVDEDRLRALSREMDRELSALEARIYGLAGGEFNVNSPKQLQQILFEKLQLPPAKRIKTGFSTDESVLEELALSYELPREILSYRRLVKLKGTYVDALPRMVNPETGRIHCTFHQTVAATGRLSCSNPNLQNIPVRTELGQRIREAFIPAEGRVLLSADYSQIELRILASLSQDEVLLDAFRRGKDIHVRTASEVFGVPEESVTPERRERIKAINFGILYGSSAFGIAQQLGIAQNEAREHIRAYFERYPRVRACLDGLVERARERGFAETLYGRRRPLPDLRSRNRVVRSAAERMAVNSVIQGTAADIIKRAMVEIDSRLRAPGARPARMILQIHDELLFEVPPTDAEALGELVSERMCAVAELAVPLEVHVGVGRSWLDAH
jgi:DNA polymerase-1